MRTKGRRGGHLSTTLWATIVVFFSLGAGPARGQDSGAEELDPDESAEIGEARRHFQRAVSLFHNGDLDAALAEFRASYQLNPIPQVLYNIAVTQRDLRRYADAVDTLRRYLVEGLDEPQERQELARELLSELEAVLAAVRVECDQPGADLFVDGELAGQTPLDYVLRLAAGQHSIELRLDGFQTHRQGVEVHGGQRLDLNVELEAIRTPWHRTWWFWTSVGGGVALTTIIVVVAVVLTRPSGADFGVSVVSGGAQ